MNRRWLMYFKERFPLATYLLLVGGIMLSTAAMVRIGKVYRNLMIDMRPTNGKLADRADKRTGTPSLGAASQNARTKMSERTGRLTVRCHPTEACTAQVDDAPFSVDNAAWVTAGNVRGLVESGKLRVIAVGVLLRSCVIYAVLIIYH